LRIISWTSVIPVTLSIPHTFSPSSIESLKRLAAIWS
jgi:hypothetical protein